jgi:hypothetical protein
VEDEEEEEEGGEETAREQDVSTKIRTYEQVLHCMSEVMQFAIDSHFPALLNYCVQLRTGFKNIKKLQKSGLTFLCWICGRNFNELYIGNVLCAV